MKKGDVITNGKNHTGVLQYNKENSLLGFITAENGDSYIVAINNQLITGWEKCHD